MSKKVKSKIKKTKVNKPLPKRNPLALNPLMKKSHIHTKSTKVERAKDKQALKKELHKSESDDG